MFGKGEGGEGVFDCREDSHFIHPWPVARLRTLRPQRATGCTTWTGYA